MRRNNIFKSLATLATALILAVSCASDPDVVAAGEDDALVGTLTGTASYVDEQTIRFTATDAKFEPIESVKTAMSLAECFKVNVSSEEVTNEGTPQESRSTVYSADFTGYTINVDSDGSLLIEVADPYLSSSDVVKLTYKQDSSIADLKDKDGNVLSSFSYIVVDGTGDGSMSYEVAKWEVTKDGTITGVYPIEHIKNTSDSDYVFTDMSNTGTGKEMYIKSGWLDLNGDEVDGDPTSFAVTAAELDALVSGMNSISMQSVFTRPVYAMDNGVRIYSHKITDDNEYKGLYQLDKEFEFKVYSESVDAIFKLFTDEALQNEIAESGTYTDGGLPIYKIGVGEEFFMSDQTYPTAGSEPTIFNMTCKWELDYDSETTGLYLGDESKDDGLEVAELDSDLARAMFYKAANSGTYVNVKFTAMDDRSVGAEAAADTKEFALSISLDESLALYTAEIINDTQMILTLEDDTYSFINEAVADDFNTTFIARRLSISSAADSNGRIAGATFTDESGDLSTVVEIRSESVEMIAQNDATQNPTQLLITFPQKFYDGEQFALMYNGYSVNYLGEVASTFASFELSDKHGDYDEAVSLVSAVPIAATVSGEAGTFDVIPEIRYKVMDAVVTDLGDFSFQAENSNIPEITLVLPTGTSSKSLVFKLLDDDYPNAYADYDLGESDILYSKWALNGDTAVNDVYENGEFTGVTCAFAEGQSVVELSVSSNRPSEGESLPTDACFYSSVLDLASNKYKITKSIVVNTYNDSFTSVSDLTLTYSTDAAAASTTTMTSVTPTYDEETGEQLDYVTDYPEFSLYDLKEITTNAGDPFYITLDTFGVDNLDYNVACTAGNAEYCTITKVDSTGAVVSDGNSNIVKVVFSQSGIYGMSLTARRDGHIDDYTDLSADSGTVTYTFGANVTGDVPLGVTLNYSTNSILYFTLDNGSTFNTNGISTDELLKAFSVYYSTEDEEDEGTFEFPDERKLEIKKVAFTESKSRLQLTLSGGTTNRVYGDDVVYVTYDGSVALPTTDVFGRSFPVLSLYTQTQIDASSDDMTGINAAETLDDGVPYTLVTTDDSFDLDNMPYQNLVYSGYSGTATTEGAWTYGTSSSGYTEAAIVADPVDPTKRCIKLIGNPKTAANRVLYNGTQLNLSTTIQYYVSVSILIPSDCTLETTTNALGNNLRPSFNFVFGDESAYTWGGAVTSGVVAITYANYSASTKIGQWQTYRSAGSTFLGYYTDETFGDPEYFSFNKSGTPEYNRVGFNMGYFDADIYLRDIHVWMVENRPL